MSGPLPKSWREGHIPKADTAAEHAVLIEWEAAEDALRGQSPACTCYDPVSMSYGPTYPCDHCRALELAAIDLDGYDDKRETPEVA